MASLSDVVKGIQSTNELLVQNVKGQNRTAAMITAFVTGQQASFGDSLEAGREKGKSKKSTRVTVAAKKSAGKSGSGFLGSLLKGGGGLLALGGALGAIAISTKHELVLAIVGGLFVVEAMSVIIQVLYFKKTGKRVFLMAPIHHHYEKKGWAEPQIVIRFWIISLILALIGLATLKVR